MLLLVRASHSQHPNVCESPLMECEATLFVTNLLPYLEGILFPTVSLIFTTHEVVLVKVPMS